MNLNTKLTLMSLLMAFGILQTQLAYAGDETYWDGTSGPSPRTVITGSCAGSPTPTLAPWPLGVATTATWSGPMNGDPIVKSIEIPANHTLIIQGSYELYTGPNTTSPFVRFVVRQGRTLIIDGGTLTRCNDFDWFWGGIKVEGDKNLPQTAANQGRVFLKNGATVEFAYEALDMGNGGIVEAENSNILNFRRGAAFLENDFPSTSYFKDCLFKVDNDYCLPNSESPNEYYAQKKGDEIREQYDNLYAIQRAIAKFELDSYTYYMAELDTSVATYFKHHWISFNNHKRVMEEGKHNLDMNEVEVAYLYDVVHNQFRINSSWQWCRGMLASYNRYIETTSIPFEVAQSHGLILFPNPASSILTIQTEETFDGQIVRIYNTLGQEVLRTSINNNKINIESLKNGSYILKLESKQGTYVQKFMVEK